MVENSTLDQALDTTRLPYDRMRPVPLDNMVYQWKCVALSRGSEKEFSSTEMYSA